MQRIGFTDKHTLHSYPPVYEELFEARLESATNVLEIGVFDGGSIKVWEETFPNAHVWGLDIDLKRVKVKYGPRVTVKQADAYTAACASSLPQMDVIIDDGPHTLESMKTLLKLYVPKLTSNGVLIIEDVQNISWIKDLTECVASDLRRHVHVHDRRSIKNRYDDIMFILDLARSS